MEVTQVYIVTCGCYSGYGISAVYLTREEAEASIEGCTEGDEGCGVEVWPIGEHKRTAGTFTHVAEINVRTGRVSSERIEDSPYLCGQVETHVRAWLHLDRWDGGELQHRYEPKLSIVVTGPTREQTDKVFSELKARVKADLSTLGPNIEAIATDVYGVRGWRKAGEPEGEFEVASR